MITFYTIGYEGTDIGRFLATLKNVGVKVLADVRAVPLSRKKGFSKRALQAELDAHGITYFHIGELGDPKPGRDAARAGQYAEFRAIYGRHIATPDAQAALKVLRDVVRVEPTCLMCFERDPKVCHRSIVAANLHTQDIRALDLYGDEPGRYVRHAAKLPRRRSREGSAAAQQDVR